MPVADSILGYGASPKIITLKFSGSLEDNARNVSSRIGRISLLRFAPRKISYSGWDSSKFPRTPYQRSPSILSSDDDLPLVGVGVGVEFEVGAASEDDDDDTCPFLLFFKGGCASSLELSSECLRMFGNVCYSVY